MSITVNLYTFAKKVNSTGRPSTSPVAVDCVLKDSCSVIYPVIGLDKGITWNPAAYNYAQITAFNRYYYINDWSFAEGLWWAALSVDALATWRPNIYNATEYVLRSSAAYDGTIVDTMFPATVGYTRSLYGWNGANLLGTPWAQDLSNGVYIVGIINSDSTAIGAVSYYAFTAAQFANFKDYLLGDIDWTGFGTAADLDENIFKALFDPFQYIVSVKWFPFSYSSISGRTLQSSIKIGWWEITNVECYTFSVPFVDVTHTLTVYEHPNADSRGKFLNTAPYTVYRLYAPPFGVFDLDSAIMADAKFTNGSATLNIFIRTDLISGESALTAQILPSYIAAQLITVLQMETHLSIDIQLAQIYQTTGAGEISDYVSKLVSTAANRILGGQMDSGGTRIVENLGIKDAATIGQTHLSQIGNNGSLSQFYLPFYVNTISMIMTEDALSDKGRPLCREAQLSTLAPGYVVTAGSHIALAGTETEIDSVNSALDGGVYLE